MISNSKLILFYTIQQVIPNICTKFQNPRRSSSREIFDTNFPMYYMGVRDGKKGKIEKMVKINLSILDFCPTIYLATLKVYTKFEDFGSHRCQKICDRNLYIYNQMYICTKFQNPTFSSSWEIFDEKKSLHTNPHTTHTQTLLLKRQKLYTPYILRIPGVQLSWHAILKQNVCIHVINFKKASGRFSFHFRPIYENL